MIALAIGLLAGSASTALATAPKPSAFLLMNTGDPPYPWTLENVTPGLAGRAEAVEGGGSAWRSGMFPDTPS
jgi:hypothetical protein